MYALPVGTVGVALVDAPPLPLLLFENTSAPDEAVLVEAFPLVLNVGGAVIDNDPVLFVALVGAVVVVVEESLYAFHKLLKAVKVVQLEQFSRHSQKCKTLHRR